MVAPAPEMAVAVVVAVAVAAALVASADLRHQAQLIEAAAVADELCLVLPEAVDLVLSS